jgi:hypothetical protein
MHVSKRDTIIQEVQQVPESLLDEILDFVRFLKLKALNKEGRETALESEATLAKDWLKAEEDEAWRDL